MLMNKQYNMIIMKKVLIILLSLLSLTMFAQQKKVAVYVTGNDPINDIVGSRLVDGIAKSGKYIAIERTASFLSELSKEQNYQSTGAVDDSEISRLGKQFGVDYVCVASAFDVWGTEKYISTRLIDVESAEVVVSSSSNGSIASSSQLIAVLNTLSDGLLSSFEQSKLSTAKKVAVYVSRTGNKDVDIILGDQLVAGFAHSGRYFAIERTQGFLNQLSKEQDYQHTGAVDDAELTRLGKQFGVHYVCIAKTSQLFGDYFISTRLIDVETATVVNSCNLEGVQLSNAPSVITAAQQIAEKLSDKTIQEIAYEEEQERLRIEEEKRLAEEAKRQAEEAKRIAEEEARREAERKRQQRRITESKTGSHNGYSYVDLGLPSGLKWAKYRLEGDNLYMWGEVKPDNDYRRDYKYLRNGKYINIGTNIAKTEYDVAYKVRKGKWRMPTYQDVQELIKFCKVEQIGNSYALVGPNGAYILLNFDNGPYWTASINGNGTSETAWLFDFGINGIELRSTKRDRRRNILPVCE